MKKITKVLCGILGAGLLLTGCSTVSNIKNSDSELIYNGSAAVMVDNYLYYANAIPSSITTEDEYKSNAAIAYLARLNTNVLNATSKDYSPKSVDAVTKEVVGQTNAFKFVLGDYVYYTTPKTEQVENDEGKLVYAFDCMKLYKSKLNGDAKKCLYTSANAITKIETLKYNNKYYVVLLDGTKLVKIEVNDKNKVDTIAEDVQSIALPKTYAKNREQSTLTWNGNLYYTKTNTSGNTEVKKVSVAGGEESNVWTGSSLTFVGREKDQLFYTIGSVTYKFNSNLTAASPLDSNNYKFYAAAISDINLIASDEVEYGYLFTANSKTTYVTNSGKTGVINFTANDEALSASIIAIDGRVVLLSTATGIYKAEISSAFNGNGGSVTVECATLAEMTAVSQTLYAYDGKYVYFYAQLEQVDEDGITTTDANYYLYRAKVGQNSLNNYELLSLTKTDKRHS